MQTMTNFFHHLFKRLMGVILALCFCSFLLITPFGNCAEAAKSSMTGDYSKDTVTVVRSLQETIAIPDDAEGRDQADKEAVVLITDYISRYRNRSEVNKTVSFTTMQTALNSMAGHVKTFSNRPFPETLKARLTKELTKAEEAVKTKS